MTAAEIVTETASLLAKGGRPAPRGHQQFAVQMLMNAEKPERLLRYVQWAFASRLWKEPSKTKGLLQLMRDGDWDVDLKPPQSLRNTAPSIEEQRLEYEATIAKATPEDRAWIEEHCKKWA